MNCSHVSLTFFTFRYFEKHNLEDVFSRFISKEMTKTLGIEESEEQSLESMLTLIIDILSDRMNDPDISDPNDKLHTLVDSLQFCHRNLTILKQADNFNDTLLAISELYTRISYIKLCLNSELSSIDPFIKKDNKSMGILKCIELFTSMQKIFVIQNKCFSNNSNTIHPYFEVISYKIKELEEYNQKLNQNVGIRPHDVHYNKILEVS